jgi:HlyD family secretion protein
MMRNKALIVGMVLLAFLVSVSLAACSRAQPADTTNAPKPASTAPSAATSPSTVPDNSKPASTSPAATATPGQSGAPARTGPPGSSFPKPEAASQQTSFIPANQAAAVKGSGSITISKDANLTFDTGGKIALLYVEEGDLVTKGKLLAKLDTTTLEASLAQAQVNLDQAILSQSTAELALQTAKLNLDKTKDVAQIMDVIDELQWKIQNAKMNAEADAVSEDRTITYWATIMAGYQQQLKDEKKVLSDLLNQPEYSGTIMYDITGQKYDRLTQEDVRMKELQVEAAQKTLDKAQDVIYQATTSVKVIQKQLDNAVITAPFDGLVVTLNAKQGDMVSAPGPTQKPIIYLIDPTAMEIVVAINELDIPRVKVGQTATVKINAFPDVKIEGKVTDISVLPNLQGGVVYYDTTVYFNVPAGMDIRAGMNATAEIIVE